MAQAFIDQNKKRTKKAPKGITIVELPNFGNSPLMLCAATGLPNPKLVFTDKAYNSCGFISPFVAYVYLRNVEDMDSTSHGRLTDASKRLVRGCQNRLYDDANFDLEKLDLAAGEVKGNQTSKSRFRKALDVAARSAPFVFTPGTSKPYLPLSNALASGAHDWPQLIGKLGDLLRIGKDFEDQWGWHCSPFNCTSAQIRDNRKAKRQPKTFDVKMITGGGDASLYPALPTLLEATAKLHDLMRLGVTGPIVKANQSKDKKTQYHQDTAGTEFLLYRTNHEDDIDRLLNHGKAPSNTNKRQRTPELSSSLSSSPSSSEDSGILEMPQTPDFVLDWPPGSSSSCSAYP